jgi:adenosine deaminase
VRNSALPKVLLHEHLDGGLRVATLLRAAAANAACPARGRRRRLAAWFDANAHAGSLEKYLEGFALTVAAMATPEALAPRGLRGRRGRGRRRRVLAEFRIAPLLFEPHGVPGEAAVEALLEGLAAARCRCPAA